MCPFPTHLMCPFRQHQETIFCLSWVDWDKINVRCHAATPHPNHPKRKKFMDCPRNIPYGAPSHLTDSRSAGEGVTVFIGMEGNRHIRFGFHPTPILKKPLRDHPAWHGKKWMLYEFGFLHLVDFTVTVSPGRVGSDTRK